MKVRKIDMITKVLKKFKANAFEVSIVGTVSAKDLASCEIDAGRSRNEFMANKKHTGILYLECICGSYVVYTSGSMRNGWYLVSDKFGVQNVTPIGTVKAEIIGVTGKYTTRNIFVADCSAKLLKEGRGRQ